jgi:hypothetical protein
MFSIIVCSHRPDRSDAIARHYAQVFRGHPHELIRIPDARSLCEGYARGTRAARGEVLVFSHDDVEIVAPDLPARLSGHLSAVDVVGIAGTTKLIDGAWVSAGDPHCFALVIYPADGDLFEVKCIGGGGLVVPAIQAVDGCFFACRREVAEAVGFDAATFDGFHLYDLDFSFRAHLAGFRLAVCRDIPLIHASRGTLDAGLAVYRRRFEEMHRHRLSPGVASPVREARARVPRDRLRWFCEPAGVQMMIDRLQVRTGTPPPSRTP